jgi:ABC-type transport system substrate-binding protein
LVAVVIAVAAMLGAGTNATLSDAAWVSRANALADPDPQLNAGLGFSVSTLDESHFTDAMLVSSLELQTAQQIDRNGKLHPWLAQSVTRPSPATYVYTRVTV